MSPDERKIFGFDAGPCHIGLALILLSSSKGWSSVARTPISLAFDDDRARGEGAIAFGGQLLDMPIGDRARQTIALAEFLAATSVLK
jgi:hypothetical protein